MRLSAFEVSRLPRIDFGEGAAARIPERAASFGSRALIVTGAASFARSLRWQRLVEGLRRAGVRGEHWTVSGEPSPEAVDEAVARFGESGIEVVIGIGGGSVLDAAKAIAGLLRTGRSVLDHLEGVGQGVPYEGPALPMIAVPTTAGTGSEATKNAVISRRDPEAGFKKSFRDERLVPQWAIVDPELCAGCTPERIAASGLDALTQLVESYVSARANAFTDALVRSGLEAGWPALLWWYEDGPRAAQGRRCMAYAALVSGIALAQAGLGAVHGLASPLGAFFPMSHGVACGTLLAATTAVNLRALQGRAPGHPALAKYAELGRWLRGRPCLPDEDAREALLATLEDWTERFRMPRLGQFGVREEHLPRIVAASRGGSMRTNPIELTDEELEEILRRRLG